ncbi:MAG: threonylcarbamoyl-AMP synthase [Bacteroidetes bacterium]|jgi:tRNA threonylcarbamoyl adenosine modification protein (Sua5/YciO/YrdC/YwlC family)|nr:threonylcarbamoyl-AMP synthase [Bacteroidota bacterium]
MLLQIHPETPQERLLNQVIDTLKSGGVIIFPTDTVYALGCDLYQQKAAEKVAWLKGVKLEKADFSIICNDFSTLSEYARPVSNPVFKLMKQYLPGPYTFILEANNKVPRLFKSKKRTIGIRIPDNNIATSIVEMLGHPILTTSIRDDDDMLEYTTDPELIYEKYENQVEIVINGGFGGNQPSTVVDCTGDEVLIVRQGVGEIE